MTKKDKTDIILIKKLIRQIKKGFGEKRCKTWDWQDFPNTLGKRVTQEEEKGRCANCKAQEVIIWLEDYIELIKEFS